MLFLQLVALQTTTALVPEKLFKDFATVMMDQIARTEIINNVCLETGDNILTEAHAGSISAGYVVEEDCIALMLFK